jgi:uncharacterized protein YdhG (YjbR/CyaY superfamily)
MSEETQDYITKYSEDIQKLFYELRELIIQSVPVEINEKLWAKLPSYYAGEKFVRLIPFKDHINIEAEMVLEHRHQLEGFKITSKGMVQIYLKQEIPYDVLQSIFVR